MSRCTSSSGIRCEWDGYGAVAGVTLRRSDEERAVGELLQLLDDVHRLVQQIQTLAGESTQLAEPETRERRSEHQGSVAGFDRVGEREHLLHRRDRPLAGTLRAGALQDARVAPDQAVLECRFHDRAEEPVALRHGRLARLLGPQQIRVPGAHAGTAHLRQLDVAEPRQDVQAQLAFVQLDGARAEVRPLRQPTARVLAQRDLPGVGVHPGSARPCRSGHGRGTRRPRASSRTSRAPRASFRRRDTALGSGPRAIDEHFPMLRVRVPFANHCGTNVARRREPDWVRSFDQSSDLRFYWSG